MTSDGFRLIVETDSSVMVRTIEGASPLGLEGRRGTAAEEATHDAAARWGMPDFVYRPLEVSTGSGRREIGDRLLLEGDLGVVVQVKSRERAPGNSDKEAAWIAKHAAIGARQGKGAIRRVLMDKPSMTNGRGREVTIDGSTMEWIVVVVIDHPEVPDGLSLSLPTSAYPTVAIIRRDWEFLFEQLRSSYAVARYLQRVAALDSVPIGEEPVRYFRLAALDSEAEPAPTGDYFGGKGTYTNAPVLPLEPANAEDEDAHLMIRAIMEDIAIGGFPNGSESERLRVLAVLDRLDWKHRTLAGQFLISAVDELSAAPGGTDWRIRRIAGKGDDETKLVQFGFGAASDPWSDEVGAQLRTWVELRHYELQLTNGADPRLVTMGIALTPRLDGGTRFVDTSAVTFIGEIELTDKEVALRRSFWDREARPRRG